MLILEHDIQFYRDNVITPLKNCRAEFTENVWQAYEDRNIDDFLKGMCQKHGYDVVATLISERIKDCLWDGRYSRDVKSWAENYKTSLPVDEISERVLQSSTSMDTHPVILNFCAGTLIEIKEEMQKSSSEEPSKTEPNTPNRILKDVSLKTIKQTTSCAVLIFFRKSHTRDTKAT